VEERARLYDEEAVRELKKLSPEELRTKWWDNWNPDRSLIERDSVVEAMKQKEIYPSDWMHERETTLGLYPDTLDPEFAAHLFEKKEYSDLQSVRKETDTCGTTEFDTSAVQRFIARFMNPETPYTSALLFHGVGVGKTCSAITVAETFLKKHPDKKVFILVPPSISPTFRKTIFDVDRLVKLPYDQWSLLGRKWNSSQCTGLTYLELSDMLNEDDKTIIASKIKSIIDDRYVIKGYGAFANDVDKIYTNIPAHFKKEERFKMENYELYKYFSDHLMIIDEAHNLRDESIRQGGDTDKKGESDAAQGKKVRTTLDRLLPVADGLRLLLMTATPMYNISTEIIGLLNLLILNDTKQVSSLLNQDEFFNRENHLRTPALEQKLRTIAQRYVSYMRGEDPVSFPLRLTPPSSMGDMIRTQYPTISISKKETTARLLNSQLENIMKALPLVATEYSDSTPAGRILQKELESRHSSESKEATTSETVEMGNLGDVGVEDAEEIANTTDSDITSKMLDPILMKSNIIYPPTKKNPRYSSGKAGWDLCFKHESIGSDPKLFQYTWDIEETTVDSVFGPSNLPNYAPKMANILHSIQHAKGMSFVFSRFVSPGIMPFAIALERSGWTRINAYGEPKPLLSSSSSTPDRQCALCIHHEKDHDSSHHAFTPANFMILTGEKEITPGKIDDFVKYATTFPRDDPYAPYGSHVKAILGSSIASEGLDLKCIREIHILDPWYHLNRIEQVIGRGVRYCSHMLLKPEERNTLIYIHVAKMKRTGKIEYETADLYAYRIAARKAIPIGIIQRSLKMGALDCNIHKHVLFSDSRKTRHIIDAQGHETKFYSLADKPYSSFCDFVSDCTYTCESKISEEKIGSDIHTYKYEDAMRRIDTQFNILRSHFIKYNRVYMPLEFVVNYFKNIVPWEYVAIGFRNKLNNPYYLIKQKDGTRGMFQIQNGYLVVQPISITESELPFRLRLGESYGRLPVKMRSPFVSVRTVEHTESASVLEETVIRKIKQWIHELEELIDSKHAYDKKRAAPEGIKKSMYKYIQWMPHRFKDFVHIQKILIEYYIDRCLTLEERNALLYGIVQRETSPTPLDTRLRGIFRNPELFKGGYMSVSRKGILTKYCKTGDVIKECSPAAEDELKSIIMPPLDGLTNCSFLYGFHIFNKNYNKSDTNIMFKRFDTETLKGKKKQIFKGFNCVGASNLGPLLTAVNVLYAYQEENKITELEFIKLKKDTKLYLNKSDGPSLTGEAICAYIEILLRAFQSIEKTNLRWILSLIDTVRAEKVIIQKGKPTTSEKIFQLEFKWES